MINVSTVVLPDRTLGNVLREYREVRRKANVGERIKVVREPLEPGKVGKTFTVTTDDEDPYRKYWWGGIYTDGKWSDGSQYNPTHDKYVVLEPTDIVRIGDVRYRMVGREAVEGDRIIVTQSNYKDGEHFATGHVGTVIKGVDSDGCIFVNFNCEGNSFVDGRGHRYVGPAARHSTYAVLERVDVTPDATDQFAHIIANLERRIDALERRACGCKIDSRTGTELEEYGL